MELGVEAIAATIAHPDFRAPISRSDTRARDQADRPKGFDQCTG